MTTSDCKDAADTSNSAFATRVLLILRYLDEVRKNSRGGSKDVVFLEAHFVQKRFERGIDSEALTPLLDQHSSALPGDGDAL